MESQTSLNIDLFIKKTIKLKCFKFAKAKAVTDFFQKIEIVMKFQSIFQVVQVVFQL